MSLPPSEDNLPEDLIRAYRRASAADGARPSQDVRDSILAQARQLLANRAVAAERPFEPATAAANESHWKWKAAASIAAVGLTGLLAVHGLRTGPHAPPLAGSAATADQTLRVTENSTPAAAQPTPPMQLAQAHGKIARGDDEHREVARQARSAPLPASAAPQAAPRPRRDQAIEAARAAYPDLFSGAAGSAAAGSAAEKAGTAQIAVVLNSDGTVYKIGRQDFAGAPQSDAGAQINQALGVRPDELESPADTMTLPATTEQHQPVTVVFGVRRDTLGTRGAVR